MSDYIPKWVRPLYTAENALKAIECCISTTGNCSDCPFVAFEECKFMLQELCRKIMLEKLSKKS